jgi:hypothetical protein
VAWFLSLRVEVPTVVGWLRLTVLIPKSGLASMTLRQVEALLAHEIAHIRRYDYLVNLGQVVVEAVLFFHPAVWRLSRRILVERENCCDGAATALCDGDRLLVARALLVLEVPRCGRALRVAADGASLKARVRRFVAQSPPTPGRADAGWAGGILVAGQIALAAAAWLAGPTKARNAPVTARTPHPGWTQSIDDPVDANNVEPVDIGEVIAFGRQAQSTISASEGAVWGVAFTADGNVLGMVAATQGGDRGGLGVLRFDDLSGSRPSVRLNEPAGLRTIAFAPDGKTLATGGHDRTVKLRDTATGAVLRTLGRYDEPVAFRNTPTGELFDPRPGFGNVVRTLAFSPDGRFPAAGCLKGFHLESRPR